MSRDENSQHTKGEKVEVRSREINVLDFVKSRMKQIAELLEVKMRIGISNMFDGYFSLRVFCSYFFIILSEK